VLTHPGRQIAKHTLALLLLSPCVWPQQPISSYERGRAIDMLQTISSDVRKHYYDPKLHGVDFDAQVAETKKEIETST